MKLQGKPAIITGAAKGIGAAAARRFAAEGARIVLADKDEANGHEVAKAIVKEGGQAAFCLCDVGNEADVQAALDTAARTYGKLDIVVNNAGWQLNKTLLETTAEEFNAVLNTNLTSMFLFTKGAANMFIAQKTGGAIVNVCSTFAVVGSPQSNTRLPGGTGTLPLPFHAASSIHEPTLPISDLPYTLYWIFVGFPACKAPLPIPLFRASGISGRGNAEAAYTMV